MLFKKSQEEVNPPSNHSTLLPQAPRHTRTKGKIAALCGEHGLVLHSLGNSGLLGWVLSWVHHQKLDLLRTLSNKGKEELVDDYMVE